jgi:hypothetical protein
VSEQQSAPTRPPVPAAEPARGARRYPRTFGGLVASMIVLVVGVLIYWVVQNATHDTQTTDESVPDWQTSVAQVQTVEKIAYPSTVPAGWTVTSADWDKVDDPQHPLWKLGMVTPGQQFVGIYQQEAPATDLVRQTVAKGAPHSVGTQQIASRLGTSWEAWAGTSDHEYTIAIGSTTLVVYGTDDGYVRQLIGILTTDKLPASDQS